MPQNPPGDDAVIRWLARKFWEEAPVLGGHDTLYSPFNEEDGVEVLRVELSRIASALERWERVRDRK